MPSQRRTVMRAHAAGLAGASAGTEVIARHATAATARGASTGRPRSRPSGRGVGRPAYTAFVSVTSPLLGGLNDIQREAVLHTEGPVLIVAGAGSGKTRALTHRIAYLVRERDVRPGQILAITFTNKAAREMARRVEGWSARGAAGGMWILTFHSTCARLLRREHPHLGLPSTFTIYDDGDTERLISGIVRDLDIDPKRFPPKAMAAAIGKAKDQVIDADASASSRRNFYEEMVAKVYRAYEERKKEAGALDFDDLITETVRLFRDHPDVLAPLPGAVPVPAGRRVPGHDPRPVRAGEPARRPLPQRLRRRRRRPGRVLVARRHHPEHPRLRARLPRRQGVPDGAELPVDGEHPGRGERADRAQHPAQAQGAVDRGRAPASWSITLRGERRARGGDVRRLRDRAAARRGGVPDRRRRGLLPDERDVPRGRGHVHARRACPTACSAACGSTSAARSRTSSATCGCCSTRRT